MPSVAELIDFEALLVPIPGDNPAGENLQYAGLHDEIREARRQEDPNLAQGDWKRELKDADWDHVVALSTDALASKTKDLQVCAWLTEALVKQHGFAGLRDGMKLMRGLHERFWDNLFPEIDEGDMEARANSLSWMDRQLAGNIKEVLITKAGGGTNYNFLQWEGTKLPEDFSARSEEERKQVKELTDKAAEEWAKIFRATRRAFYEETLTMLNECWEEFRALDRVMDGKFGRQTPGLGELKKALDAVRTLVEKLVKEKRVLEPDPVSATAAEATATEPIVGTPVVAGTAGPIRGRQEALRRLSEVAEFFRKTEPHSPVSYLVQRAVKWGEMPLDKWLEDVIKESSTLESLRETLGIKPGTDGSAPES